MNKPLPDPRSGLTLMEIIAVVAIIIILAAIIVPVSLAMRTQGDRAVALERLRMFASLCGSYAADHSGKFPREDADGPNTWAAAAAEENKDVWYNALPRVHGARGVADYEFSPGMFYAKESLFFLPGAGYPKDDQRMSRPLFAFAMNSRLQRKSEDGSKDLRISQIEMPSRTVLFLEQGLKNDKKRSGIQTRFDGAPKATARSLPSRYGGLGVIAFVDGHAELYDPLDLVTQTGSLPYPQSDVVWTPKVNEDPN